jgi:hypothetical protein
MKTRAILRAYLALSVAFLVASACVAARGWLR